MLEHYPLKIHSKSIITFESIFLQKYIKTFSSKRTEERYPLKYIVNPQKQLKTFPLKIQFSYKSSEEHFPLKLHKNIIL